MTYKGLEYQNDVIVFDKQEDALRYEGGKKILLNSDLVLCLSDNKTSLKNIYGVRGIVQIDKTEIKSLGELKYCNRIWLNKEQTKLFGERIATKIWYSCCNSFFCTLKGGKI